MGLASTQLVFTHATVTRVWSGKQRKKAGYLQSVALDFKLLGAGPELGTSGSRVQRSDHSLIVPQAISACRFWRQKKNLALFRLVASQAHVFMYRSIQNSHIPPSLPGNPLGIWTSQFSCGQIPHPGAKIPFKCPTSRLNSVVKCPTSCPLFLQKSDVIWAEISVSRVFPDVTIRNVMSATLNIGSPMITEGYGSCFSIWRQTRAVFMRNAARNIKSRQRIKFPTPLALWSNAPPQVRCGPSNSRLPGQGRGSNARGMPGGGGGGMCEFRI